MNGSDAKTRTANVVVWSKGFRVTRDTEEFQICAPLSPATDLIVESDLVKSDWRLLLEPLYGTDRPIAAQEHCILVRSDSIASVCYQPTRDRHRRPNLVVTGASTSIDWDRDDVGSILSRLSSLTMRLAMEYADSFMGNPDFLEKQLADGQFLSDQAFVLDHESPDLSLDWESIGEAIKRWEGVAGVATSLLLSFGANVLLSVPATDPRLSEELGLDGFFDPSLKDIVPLNPKLARWHRNDISSRPSDVSRNTGDGARPHFDESVYPLVESIRWLERSVDRAVDALLSLVDELARKGKKK